MGVGWWHKRKLAMFMWDYLEYIPSDVGKHILVVGGTFFGQRILVYITQGTYPVLENTHSLIAFCFCVMDAVLLATSSS